MGAGVSAAGAKSITDAYARGIVPPMTPDQKAGFEHAGDAYGVTSDGYKALRELENQLGLTPSDVDALKKVGKTLGHVSSALDWGVALYEVASGEKTFAHASMEVGGSMAGAWMLGEPMAAAGPRDRGSGRRLASWVHRPRWSAAGWAKPAPTRFTNISRADRESDERPGSNR